MGQEFNGVVGSISHEESICYAEMGLGRLSAARIRTLAVFCPTSEFAVAGVQPAKIAIDTLLALDVEQKLIEAFLQAGLNICWADWPEVPADLSILVSNAAFGRSVD